MISLPRSPIRRLVLGTFIVISFIFVSLQLRPSFNNNNDHGSGTWENLKESASQVRFPAEKQPNRATQRSFTVPESLHRTHDVAIPHDIPPWNEEDTRLLDTAIGYNLKTTMLKQEYGKDEDLKDHPERIDMAELARAERLYKSLWLHVKTIYDGLSGRDRERERTLTQMAKSKPEIDFFLRLEKRLYPWTHYGRQTTFSLQRAFNGRGIVICAGNNQFEFAVTAIQAIRARLKSTLPIQVFHMGDGDLSPDRQKYFREMTTDIEVIDVTQTLDNGYMKLGGWAIKPFAMLASSFEEVMFVDADVYFLQDPEVLFDDPGYKATGALFFYDRTLFPGWKDGANWLRSVTPMLSTFPPLSRMFRYLSAHEQESGVVVINKKTRLLGMLAVCKMNSKWERDHVSYKVFHGDKETFWTGFEMIQEPYAFMRSYGGVIGELREGNDKSVCGAQMHQDHLRQPLWWNGGLYRNKNSGVTRNLNFGYWMDGGGQQQHREWYTKDQDTMKQILADLGLRSESELKLEPGDAEWDFGESCLAGATVHQLSQIQKDFANSYVQIDRFGREDGAKAHRGEPIDPKKHNWEEPFNHS